MKLSFQLLELLLLFFALYNFTMSLAGLPKPRPPARRSPRHSFGIIVPAHNEGRVIAQTVHALLGLDYPRSLFRVYVVADNCTDDTAERAREAGADVVFERFHASERGKGYCLAWARQRIERTTLHDAYIVFDADNVMSRNFLLAMNDRLEAGAAIIQGYLDTKNPGDTWVTKAISTAYWVSNRLWQHARSNLGVASALGGTGYCIRRDVVSRYEPDPACLTDDLELQMRLLKEGILVQWAHEAKTYDEKPLTMRTSWRQRVRWMQGHWDVARRHAWGLLVGAVRTMSLARFDGALYCIQPSRTAIAGLVGVVLMLRTVLHLSADGPLPDGLVPLGVWATLAASYVVYPLVAMFLEGVPARMYWHFLFAIVFALTWIPITLVGMWRSRSRVWVHTEHFRSLSLDEVGSHDASTPDIRPEA
ncbi:MAG: hypothetical protein RL199_1645 [Pseudomonadota bacterium]|jgi:cellulose synthase/poly-beta-1,6-N-acetylglucosamine synthase-like glycosyltransferase